MAKSDQPRLHKTTGTVIETYKDRAIVELDVDPHDVGKQPQCSGCGLCSSAGAGSGKVELRACLTEGMSVQKDDRVEVEIRLVEPSRAALLLYGLPLLAFLGASLGVWFGTGSQSASAISGFSALGAAFLILFLVERGKAAGARISRKI